MKDNGGPAFPTMHDVRYSPLWGTAVGMTLRDYFAAKVLAGIWTNSELLKTLKLGQEAEAIATAAYEMADAMLKAKQE